ncbi:uncharacterized protein A1O9_00231 [Exophiala aquamarina CBS 119918]|uniref:Uncharacterized protein n=1 Tax=Exophiala aquamarina CBS 119918 TaxID=1182545 RepID=A0A072PQA3_9EURO|nr:uncharacterized protein A1O9_00231 [Exophiala aquamarina CBS 119918]KEF62259.1 hypothetical protein A1O9_00231 [Exophiala aquamarina CBS 119918]
MPQIYLEAAACSPSQKNDVYVFTIVPVAGGSIAAITSADELVLLHAATLQTAKIFTPQDGLKGLTSLVSADDGTSAVCASNDGVVTVFDIRTPQPSAQFQTGKSINALASKGLDLAIGTETTVSVWDRRQARLRWQNGENNDEITSLDFHPSQGRFLLSGGDDGLVSVFDTQITEEDDSLIQAINHGPVHKAGFFGSDDLYALSSDQNLALHSLTLDDTDTDRPAPDLLGDLRPIVPCEYVLDIFRTGSNYVAACGSHSKAQVDLVKLQRGSQLDFRERIVLKGTHGGEIVRSIFADDNSGVIFTAGEDGRVAAFTKTATTPTFIPPPKAPKSKVGPEGRYKPY